MAMTLTGAKIRFNTHNDNKDHDTCLDVVIKNKVNLFLSEEIAAALNLDPGTEFVDPSTHEYNLPLSSSGVLLSDINVPAVNIHIQPNARDRWIFDDTVSLIFNDGSGGPGKTFSSTTNGVILDQDNKDYVGMFQGLEWPELRPIH